MKGEARNGTISDDRMARMENASLRIPLIQWEKPVVYNMINFIHPYLMFLSLETASGRTL